MRRTLNQDLQNRIYEKYESKCYICKYSIKETLIVHHIIPIKYLGKNPDEEDNLILVCSNCHKIIHRFSSKKYENIDIYEYLSAELTLEQIEKVKKLVLKFLDFKKTIKSQGNLVKNPYSLNEAINIVCRKNGFSSKKKLQLEKVINLIISLIPDFIAQKSAYRLLKKGKYISINLMNYLLFRTPGFGDFGEMPTYECLIILPEGEIPKRFKPVENREPFYFKYAPVINLGLSFRELLDFSEKEKKLFQKSCELVNSSRKTRNWISNIKLSKI